MGDLLTPLTVLEQLRELKLLACNFYNDRVDVLLLKSGHRLHTLHLEHIDELDMNALCCIADTCINLQTHFVVILSLSFCICYKFVLHLLYFLHLLFCGFASVINLVCICYQSRLHLL